MKRSFKCFGLLLVLSIMVGLSLSVSSNVNALKHEINSIPIADYSLLPSFNIYWTSDYLPDNLNVTSPRLFGSGYTSNQCVYYNSAWDYSYSDYSIGFKSYPSDTFSYYDSTSLITGIGSPICRQLKPFGQDSVPSMADQTLPSYVLGRPDYRSMLPYWYDYDAYILASSQVDTSSGMSYSYKFKFSDVWGVSPNKFKSMTIPLSFVSPDKVGTLSSGRSIRLDGTFDFSGPGNYVNLSSDFTNNGTFKIVFTGYVPDLGITSQSISCSSNLISLEFNGFLQLEFSCSGTLSYAYDYGAVYLVLSSDASGQTYVWDTNAIYSFSLAYFITDNDDTLGVALSDPISGGNIESSPSGRYFDSVMSNNDDFFSSLVNLFDFSLLNPFAPIFAMFTTQEQCASIPTLASMLHSTETRVCPWFDSNTRSIVTPVLSLGAMMLLFGFAVRWLSGSSGNMFIDDDIKDTGHSFSLRNRFQSWRRK